MTVQSPEPKICCGHSEECRARLQALAKKLKVGCDISDGTINIDIIEGALEKRYSEGVALVYKFDLVTLAEEIAELHSFGTMQHDIPDIMLEAAKLHEAAKCFERLAEKLQADPDYGLRKLFGEEKLAALKSQGANLSQAVAAHVEEVMLRKFGLPPPERERAH